MIRSMLKWLRLWWRTRNLERVTVHLVDGSRFERGDHINHQDSGGGIRTGIVLKATRTKLVTALLK